MDTLKHHMGKMNTRGQALITVLIVIVLVIVGFLVYYSLYPMTSYNNTTSTGGSGSPSNITTITPIPQTPSYSVKFTSIPSSGMVGQPIPISWHIDGSGTTKHTAAHYDTKSVSSPTGPSDYQYASNYQCTDNACNLPSDFSDTITINTAGTYYIRAHTVVNGKNYWSNEKMITIMPSQNNTSGSMSSSGSSYNGSESNMSYIIHFTDNSFDPYLLSIAPGATVTWINDGSKAYKVVFNNGMTSGLIPANGGYYSYKFNTAGTYLYYESGRMTVHGQVTVGNSSIISAMQSSSSASGSSSSSGGYSY